MESDRLTLAEIRGWPPTVDVTHAALALGVSRSSLYQAIQRDVSLVAVIRVNRRLLILTASLVEVLEGGSGGRAASA